MTVEQGPWGERRIRQIIGPGSPNEWCYRDAAGTLWVIPGGKRVPVRAPVPMAPLDGFEPPTATGIDRAPVTTVTTMTTVKIDTDLAEALDTEGHARLAEELLDVCGPETVIASERPDHVRVVQVLDVEGLPAIRSASMNVEIALMRVGSRTAATSGSANPLVVAIPD